ncbi:hypothetical protein Micbo1qcDRAFT_159078 [Microdochium bolleyi]|uniref:Uncharacterized protein n=1 Tax=Microdochium bolleyi TaxID=196109 RepID=A0A136JAD5_9PEZI|nr:hypothetical protein Micbo1qcDRAFT_159078 [Microdochium bolleyi]
MLPYTAILVLPVLHRVIQKSCHTTIPKFTSSNSRRRDAQRSNGDSSIVRNGQRETRPGRLTHAVASEIPLTGSFPNWRVIIHRPTARAVSSSGKIRAWNISLHLNKSLSVWQKPPNTTCRAEDLISICPYPSPCIW